LVNKKFIDIRGISKAKFGNHVNDFDVGKLLFFNATKFETSTTFNCT